MLACWPLKRAHGWTLGCENYLRSSAPLRANSYAGPARYHKVISRRRMVSPPVSGTKIKRRQKTDSMNKYALDQKARPPLMYPSCEAQHQLAQSAVVLPYGEFEATSINLVSWCCKQASNSSSIAPGGLGFARGLTYARSMAPSVGGG